MKKRILTILAAALIIANAGAYEPMVMAEDITVVYEGETVDFDVPAQIIDDRTMVPMRKVFELFGMKVKWDSETQTITARKNSKTITMKIGEKEITLSKGNLDADGNEIIEQTTTCDVPPQVVNDRTLIPVRAVSELLELDVIWNEAESTVEIQDNSISDDSWKENTGEIDFDAGTVSGSGAVLSDGVLTITEGGDFNLSGTVADGCVVINTEDRVKLRLNGVSITNSAGPAIYVANSDKTYITISDETENTLSDGAEYSGSYADLKGCISAKDKLEIKGGGSLTITSAVNHGIKASDNLSIEAGNIRINSGKDGINVNDTFSMIGGTLNITAEGDGIASDSIVDITGGVINITTTGAVTASSNGRPFGGRGQSTTVKATAEPTATTTDISSKGIKADWLMEISGGVINVNSTDHALHCQSDIIINDGSMTLNSSVKKGISSHEDLTVNGGYIDVTNSTEGMESKGIMMINDGEIHLYATDDGLNAGGNETEMGGGDGMPPNGMQGGERPEMTAGSQTGEPGTPPNGMHAGGPGMMGGTESSEKDSSHHIQINGGYIYINAAGDGVDSNGSFFIDGGTVIVEGPTNDGNGAIDAEGAVVCSGGTLIASGSSGMSMSPNSYSAQNILNIYFDSALEAGTLIHIEDESGNHVLNYSPSKSFSNLVFSSSALQTGKTYKIYSGGSCTGTIKDGVYTGGEYTEGTLLYESVIREVKTSLGTATNTIGGGRGGMHRQETAQ